MQKISKGVEKKDYEAKRKLGKKIIKNSFFNFLATISSRIGGFIFTIIIARMLFPEPFGIYSLTLSIIMVLSVFVDLGISSTFIRYVSEALGKNKKREAKAYFKFLLNLKIFLTIGFSLALFFLAKIIAFQVFHKPLLILPLQIASIYLFTLSLYTFFTQIPIVIQKLKYYTIADIILQASRISLVFLLLNLLKSVSSVFISLIISTFIALGILIFIINKKYRFFFKEKPIAVNKKRVLKFLGLLSITSVGGAFFAQIDTLMLGAFVPSEYVGFYKAAFSIVYSMAALITITNVLYPIFTQLHGKNLKIVFRKIFHYSTLISFPFAFGLIFFAKPVIKIIYGSSYSLAVLPVYILSFLIISSASGSFFSTLFKAKEKPKYITIMFLIATAMNIILNYVLITTFLKINVIYSIVGAALATLISRYFYFISLSFFAKKKLKISFSRSSILKPLFSSIVMLISLFIFNYFTHLIWPISIIEIFFGVVVYFVVMFLTKGITKEDLKIIKFLNFKK